MLLFIVTSCSPLSSLGVFLPLGTRRREQVGSPCLQNSRAVWKPAPDCYHAHHLSGNQGAVICFRCDSIPKKIPLGGGVISSGSVSEGLVSYSVALRL